EKSRISHNAKHVIILISDDKDDASNLKRTELLTAIKQSDALIYAIRVVVPGGTNLQSNFFRELSSVTGAIASFPTSNAEFKEALEIVALELKHQYRVSFHSPVNARLGEWHRLELSVKPLEVRDNPSAKKLKKIPLVGRIREGYYVSQ